MGHTGHTARTRRRGERDHERRRHRPHRPLDRRRRPRAPGGPEPSLRASRGVPDRVPAPGVRHQRVSHRLHVAIEAAARAAGAPVEILEAVNVRTPGGMFIPDLVVVDQAATVDDPAVIDPEAVQLVVEIVSPSNADVDRTVKPIRYAEASIPHYWRVEMLPTPRIIMGNPPPQGRRESPS
ncbi:Uma2 family endonuclease [Streptomyces sp. NPDC001939]